MINIMASLMTNIHYFCNFLNFRYRAEYIIITNALFFRIAVSNQTTIEMMSTYRISLLLLPFLASVLSHKPHVALKFGDDLSSYIMIDPDISPLEEAISVCSWVKQLSPTSRKGIWMHYFTQHFYDEITLTDNLVWAYLHSTK